MADEGDRVTPYYRMLLEMAASGVVCERALLPPRWQALLDAGYLLLEVVPSDSVLAVKLHLSRKGKDALARQAA